MGWIWPTSLFFLGLIPLLVALYIWAQRRRKRYAVRYSSLSLIREALPRFSQVRRHLPFGLLMLALLSLIVALARPISIVSIPSNQTTIILAIDVSRSMLATDIQPNRLLAAESAALSFIRGQKASTRIGIVAFAGFAEMVQAPTTDQAALEAAVESLITGRGTAIGSAILESIDTIALVDPNVAPVYTGEVPGVEPTPVPRGVYATDIIVVLTDGVRTTGPYPEDAAQQALDRGVRIYTIGFGTENGGIFGNTGGGMFGSNEQFDNSFNFRRGIDEETLKMVADMTGGEYYTAESADELHRVFQDLPTNIIMRHETTEISAFFVIAGVLLALLAIALTYRWNPLG
jgi:Ca-activated chloride channel family protein